MTRLSHLVAIFFMSFQGQSAAEEDISGIQVYTGPNSRQDRIQQDQQGWLPASGYASTPHLTTHPPQSLGVSVVRGPGHIIEMDRTIDSPEAGMARALEALCGPEIAASDLLESDVTFDNYPEF